jgi:hypothetical protein
MTRMPTVSLVSRDCLVEQLATALTEVGLPVDVGDRLSARGGVWITNAVDGSGLEVRWVVGESLADDEARAVQRIDVVETMNLALADLLTIVGWDARPSNDCEGQIVVGRRPFRTRVGAGAVLRG